MYIFVMLYIYHMSCHVYMHDVMLHCKTYHKNCSSEHLPAQTQKTVRNIVTRESVCCCSLPSNTSLIHGLLGDESCCLFYTFGYFLLHQMTFTWGMSQNCKLPKSSGTCFFRRLTRRTVTQLRAAGLMSEAWKGPSIIFSRGFHSLFNSGGVLFAKKRGELVRVYHGLSMVKLW